MFHAAPPEAGLMLSFGTLVLDEADEMLDMGFAEDLEAILGRRPGSPGS